MALISKLGLLTFISTNLSYQPVKVKMEIPLTLPSPLCLPAGRQGERKKVRGVKIQKVDSWGNLSNYYRIIRMETNLKHSSLLSFDLFA
jgi:hypothetical protein